MPTHPVVWACKVNVMVSPLTAYVTLYAPFDENLLPKHMSAGCIIIQQVLDYVMCVYIYIIGIIILYDNCRFLYVLKG